MKRKISFARRSSRCAIFVTIFAFTGLKVNAQWAQIATGITNFTVSALAISSGTNILFLFSSSSCFQTLYYNIKCSVGKCCSTYSIPLKFFSFMLFTGC